MHKLDGYTIDESCEFTPEELEMVLSCEDDEETIYLDGKPIGKYLPMEARYCKKVTGMDYEEFLKKMLSEIDADPWIAARKLFPQFGEEYEGDDDIPGMTAYAMQDYVDKIATAKKG